MKKSNGLSSNQFHFRLGCILLILMSLLQT